MKNIILLYFTIGLLWFAFSAKGFWGDINCFIDSQIEEDIYIEIAARRWGRDRMVVITTLVALAAAAIAWPYFFLPQNRKDDSDGQSDANS